jgi:FKBP-type peptidyl-prolyl cis-trans isomerase 2
MIQTIAVTEFEEAEIDWQAWEIGEKYTFGQIQGTVKTINEDAVTIDFNHFLAGKDLVFTATVEDITR